MKFIIRKHIEEKVPLEIIYLSDNGKISQRKIQVLEVYPRYIHAFCFLRRTKRTFKIENILSARLIKSRYSISG